MRASGIWDWPSLHFRPIAAILAQLKSIVVIEDNKDSRLLVRSLLTVFYTSTYMKQYILPPF